MPFGFFDHDHRTDALRWSHEQRRIYGIAPEVPVTQALYLSYVHPDDRGRIEAAVRSAHDPAGAGVFDVEHRIIDAQGRTRWLQTRSQTFFEGEGSERQPTRTVGAVQDVTEQRERKQAEETLRAIVNNSVDMVAVIDASGMLSFVSGGTEQVLGFRPEELHGRSALDFVHPDEVERVVMVLSEVASTPAARRTLELRFRRKDGTWRHIESVGVNHLDDPAIGGIVVNTRDVTERRTVEAALRESEAHLEEAQRIAHLGSWSWDAATDTPYWSKELCSILEVDSSAPVPKVSEQDRIYTPASMQRMLAAISRAMQTGEPYEIELERVRAPKPSRFLLARGEVRRDASGAIVGLRGTALDITERKRLEAQLMQAQKMESIGRLAGGVAHDFNNLLTVIIGCTKFVLEDLGRDHAAVPLLTDVVNAASSAGSLTHQLLAFSRKQIIAPEVLSLNAVVERTKSMLRRLIGEDIDLQTRCAADPAVVRLDPGQAEQIIFNLAVNARDAMSAGGVLRVETANVHIDEPQSHESFDLPVGHYVRLSVSDTGSGMSEQVKAHLFEPFYTTKEQGKGTGLGLAMVYGAVKQNGGHIEVISEIGHGTTFHIYLPPLDDASLTTAGPSAAPGARGREVVLLVEDDALVRKFTRRALEREGYHVHAFDNGVAALAAVTGLSPRPDILVTDVVMPGMNGHDLSQRLAAQCPGLAVLFVSGYAQDILAPHDVLSPGVALLVKPFSPQQLLGRVRALLDDRNGSPE